MSDLISRQAALSVLMKHYEDCEKAYEKTKGRAWEYMMLTYSRAIGEVKTIDCAYDVDKVVSELKNASCGTGEFDRTTMKFKTMMIEESDAIEIVKGGGQGE